MQSTSRSCLLRAPAREIEIEIGENDHDEQENVGHGSRVARLVELDCLPVDIDRDRLGRGAGPAFGKQENDIEELECLDRPEQKREQQEAADIGESDRPE